MGRNRKSTEDLERSGAFDKNPQRAAERANEPKPEGPLGDPPAAFLNPHSPTSAELLQIWKELLEQAKYVKLTSADRFHFEATCRLMFRVRRPGAKTGDFAQLHSFLSKLGLNPSDRSKVEGNSSGKTGDEDEEEWQDIAREGAAQPRVQ